MRRTKCRFRLTATFFVINENQLEEYNLGVRKNVLHLVHYGFTREEVYFMPLGEMIDYIKIINQEIEEEEAVNKQVLLNKQSSSDEDVKMAGNSLPGSFF